MRDTKLTIAGLEETIKYFRHLREIGFIGNEEVYKYHEESCEFALELLKEQEEEIKHLRLALDIMKGKGIVVNDGLKHYDDGSTEP